MKPRAPEKICLDERYLLDLRPWPKPKPIVSAAAIAPTIMSRKPAPTGVDINSIMPVPALGGFGTLLGGAVTTGVAVGGVVGPWVGGNVGVAVGGTCVPVGVADGVAVGDCVPVGVADGVAVGGGDVGVGGGGNVGVAVGDGVRTGVGVGGGGVGVGCLQLGLSAVMPTPCASISVPYSAPPARCPSGAPNHPTRGSNWSLHTLLGTFTTSVTDDPGFRVTGPAVPTRS